MPTQPYLLKDGSRVPGTTTIIGRFKDSGPLMHWAFKRGKEGAEALYDSEATDIGTVAHSAVEAHLHGEPIEPIFEAAPLDIAAKARRAFNEYLAWAKLVSLEIVATEIPLVSEVHKFGGCLDAVGRIGNELVLLDWKTSSAVFRDYLVQLAAYQTLWNETHPEQQLADTVYLCRFSKAYADFEWRKFSDLSEAFELFLLYRKAFELDLKLKARVK